MIQYPLVTGLLRSTILVMGLLLPRARKQTAIPCGPGENITPGTLF